MSSALKRALPTKNVCMNYQPIVNMRTRECVGAEALLRWNNDGVQVAPDHFIVAAEKAGIMGMVTQRVASLVAWDMANYIRTHPDFHVSINLSAADLKTDATFKLLSGFLRMTGMPGSSLWVEVTETGFVDPETGALAVEKIKEMGIRVAVDDFGTGYSSLAMLGSLKVDILKIDRRFTQTIITGGAAEEGSEIVCAIINLAKSLGLEMVAEGVETEEQAEFLLANGVHYGQGWLFGRPKPIQDFF
jgi:sensor c-di-GMP phosphodiesterase-like protein